MGKSTSSDKSNESAEIRESEISTPPSPPKKKATKERKISAKAYLKSCQINSPARLRYLNRHHSGASRTPEEWKRILGDSMNRKVN